MSRLSAAVATLMLVAATGVSAAPPGEVAVICDQDVAPYRALVEGLRKACPHKVRVITREEAAEPGLEQRLKAAGVGAVVAVGMQSRAAAEGLRELPVLLAMVPRTEPWVAAGPNRFGIEMALSPRQNLETMRRVFPRARRVGLIFDPGQTGGYAREAGVAAAEFGLTLVTREIGRPADLSRRLEELRGQIDVIWLLPDPTVLQGANLDILLLASFESRVPIYAFARKYVELGAVAAAHLDPAAMGAQAAAMLECLAPAGSSPAKRWEYARGAELIVNQKVARKMGLELDPDLLESADDVVR